MRIEYHSMRGLVVRCEANENEMALVILRAIEAYCEDEMNLVVARYFIEQVEQETRTEQ